MKYRNFVIKWMNALESNRKMITPTHLSGLCCWKWISDLVLIRIISPPFAAAAPTAHILKRNDLIFCQLPRSSFPSNSERVTKFKVKHFSENRGYEEAAELRQMSPLWEDGLNFQGRRSFGFQIPRVGYFRNTLTPKVSHSRNTLTARLGYFRNTFLNI